MYTPVLALIVVLVLVMTASGALAMKARQESSTSSSGSSGSYSFTRLESCFMRKVNGARRRHGRRPLRYDKQLGYVARRHAARMARSRAVFHDGNMTEEITRWRALAQNTGAGGSCRRTFRSFMRSSEHRYNILGRWRYMGAGVKTSGGRVYIQHIFETRDNPGNVYHWP